MNQKIKIKKSITGLMLMGIILVLLINMVLVLSEEKKPDPKDEEIAKKVLEERGFVFGTKEWELKSEDVELSKDGKTVIIKESGVKKQVDVSRIKGKILVELPKGGKILYGPDTTSPNVEIPELLAASAKNNEGKTLLILGEKSRVTIIDGEAVLEKIKIEEGSIVNGNMVSGEIASSKEGVLTFEQGKGVSLNGYKFIPENNEPIVLDNNLISTNGKDVAIYKEGNYAGKLNGNAEVFSDKAITLLGTEKDEAVFINDKGTKISVSGTTTISEGKCVGENCIGDIVSYDKDLKVYTQSESKNKIKIEAKDGDYENVIIKKFSDSGCSIGGPCDVALKPAQEEDFGKSEVKIELKRTTDNGKESKTIFDFKSGMPIVSGNTAELKTNLGYMLQQRYEGKEISSPWLLYNGEVLTGEKIGEIYKSDPFKSLEGIKEQGLKELVIKSLTLNPSDTVIESALKYIGDNKGLQKTLIDELNFASTPELLRIAKNNPELQGEIVSKTDFKSDFSSKDLADSILALKGNEEAQQYLVDNFPEKSFISGENAKTILDAIKDNENYEQLKSIVNPRIDGILDLDAFGKMSSEDKKSLIEETNFFSSSALKTALEKSKGNNELQELILTRLQNRDLRGNDVLNLLEASAGNKELQNKILDLYNPSPSMLGLFASKASNDFSPFTFREKIATLDPETLVKVLKISDDYFSTSKETYPGWDSKKMADIYSSQEFLDKTKDLTNIERWSVGLSIAGRLEQQGIELDARNIGKTTDEIMTIRESGGKIVLASKDTETFIPITNNEAIFQEDKMVSLAKDSGVSEDAIKTGLKGSDSKSKIIEAIEKRQGETTIFFNNHGSYNYQYLGGGMDAGPENSDPVNKPGTISYKELGDSLIAGAKDKTTLSDVKIVIDSCYSKNYAQNLYAYLDKNGVTNMPAIAAVTNNGQLGWSFGSEAKEYKESGINSAFLYSLDQTRTKGSALTINDVYKAENVKKTFRLEDSAVFVPYRTETKTGVTRIGSPDDREKTIPADAIPMSAPKKTLPKSVIEVGQVEDAMAKELAYA